MHERGGEVRVYKVPNLQGRTVKVVASKNVIPGSCILTDEFRGYRAFSSQGYVTDSVIYSAGEYARGSIRTNTIEGAWSLFKRGVTGIYHRISDKHLQRYLDEIFGRSNTRGLEEYERVNQLLECSIGSRLTY